ncbi:MAG: metallophosphoesterase, partial [Flavobacteriaceae bacterium]|nr:metallophosphoesterase [Flavobacteriaceae bacterium]
MKIQYCSDLHLEFPKNESFLNSNPLKVEGDILILAGDILLFKELNEYKYFFNFISKNFKYTYWIPGNHEYYYSDISERSNSFKEQIRNNVFLVNNVAVIQDDIKFIFSTLWSKISLQNEWQIQKGLSDFSVIKKDGGIFTPFDYNLLHQKSIDFIEKEL